MDRKELEAVLKELVVHRLDAIAEDIKRIDGNVLMMGDALLAPTERRQLKKRRTEGGESAGYPMAASQD